MPGRGRNYWKTGACQLLFAAVATPAMAASPAGQGLPVAAVLAANGWRLADPSPGQESDAPAPTPTPAPTPVESPPQVRLNPTGRVMQITAPLTERDNYLGDVELRIAPDDSIEVAGWQIVEQLARVMDPSAIEALQPVAETGVFVPVARFGELGVPLAFDSGLMELTVELPVSARARQTIGLANLDRDTYGEFAQPESASAYMNVRMSTDYIHTGFNTGLSDPLFFMDGAARFGRFVIENEASWSDDRDFRREGTRLVYDDIENLNRWVGGDLLPQARGFQGIRDMAGLSIERVYGLLDPQRNVAPRGGRSFSLDREATVEALVNGRVVRTLRLQPGTYDVSDFPFVQGSNDVDLVISDDAGRQEILSFSVFVDRTQLAPGLAEYGVYLGVERDSIAGEIEYTSDAIASAFYRRGISENLTAGANFQYLETGWMVAGEGVWGTPLGTFGGDLAFSNLDGVGDGWAVNLSYERLMQDQGGGGAALQASIEARSRYFGAPTQIAPDNRYSLNAAVSYSRSFGESSFAGVQLRYAKARDGFEDERTARVTYGHRLNEAMNLLLDASWTDGGFADGVGVRVALVRRFGATGSARAEYDSLTERGRLGYQTSGGHGVGAWSVSGSLEGGADSYGFNGAASYAANRAELGLAHTTAYSVDRDEISDQRTSLRAGTAIAFAGGRFAVGRPVTDGFVIAAPYAGSPDTVIEVEPTPEGYYARSGMLGPALYGQVSSYSPRTITYDAPEAVGGFDIGSGALRVLAPYRAGYVVTVGSEYDVTAVGRLLDSNGEPVTFLAGEAIELDGDARVEIFTNRTGVFGASGLRPGRWRIELIGQPPRVYDLVVPETEDGLARVGDLRPVQ